MRRVQKGIQTGCRFGVSLPFKFAREQVREWSITEQLWQNMLCVSVLCLAMLVESDNVAKIMNLVGLAVAHLKSTCRALQAATPSIIAVTIGLTILMTLDESLMVCKTYSRSQKVGTSLSSCP